MKIISVSKTGSARGNQTCSDNIAHKNKPASLSFKGESVFVAGYEKDFVDLAPKMNIAILEDGKTLQAKPFADGRPFLEYFDENIEDVLRQSKLFQENSRIEKVSFLKRDPSVFYPVSTQKRIENAYTGTMYRGKIYFGDIDEVIGTSTRKEHNLLVHDVERSILPLNKLEQNYTTGKDVRIFYADRSLKMQKHYVGICDYCTRKTELLRLKIVDNVSKNKQICLDEINRFNQKFKSASELLSMIKELDISLKNGDQKRADEMVGMIRRYYWQNLDKAALLRRR